MNLLPFQNANASRAVHHGAAELAVIVPTYNEADNIQRLHELLIDALAGIHWELIFVDDDSPDGTALAIHRLAKQFNNVRVMRRFGRRGLSSAVVEGMSATSADYLAVIDSDLQHDERILPAMVAELRNGVTDIVIGTRYAHGGSVGSWSASRVWMSKTASRLSRMICRADLSDPMSGFFAMTRTSFEACVRGLSGEGFKILLDVFATSPRPLRFKEIPYTFRNRQFGESKMDGAALWGYLTLILDKMVGRLVPVRLVLFSIVGLIGLIVHFSILTVAYRILSFGFEISQSIATVFAMTSNYLVNNVLTYRERSRKGVRLFTGLLGFYAVCSVGLIGNVGIASTIFTAHFEWWVAALAGIVVGTIWNFAASSVLVWGKK